jgi:hypothetical protein
MCLLTDLMAIAPLREIRWLSANLLCTSPMMSGVHSDGPDLVSPTDLTVVVAPPELALLLSLGTFPCLKVSAFDASLRPFQRFYPF